MTDEYLEVLLSSLGLINLLEELTEFREMHRQRCIDRYVGHSTELPCLPPGIPPGGVPSRNCMLSYLEGHGAQSFCVLMETPLHRHDWLNHELLMVSSTFSLFSPYSRWGLKFQLSHLAGFIQRPAPILKLSRGLPVTVKPLVYNKTPLLLGRY